MNKGQISAIRKWTSKKYREKQCRAISEGMKKSQKVHNKFKDNKYIEKLRRSTKKLWRGANYRRNVSVLVSFAIKQKYLEEPEYREKVRLGAKKRWQDENYAKKMFAAWKRKPNKLEIFFYSFLQKEFLNYFKYVGDGKIWISGKCPDFINIENKEIIELFGSYWHKISDVLERINHFAKYEYKTLVVWDYELKDLTLLKDKITKFFNIKLEILKK